MNTYRDDLVLYHHGIKGQKWGVRRWQNKDGSLTAAGRKRYGGSRETFEKGIRKSLRSATRASFRAAYKRKVANTRAIDAEREQLDEFHDNLILSRMNNADRNAIIESKMAATRVRNDLRNVLLGSPAVNTDRELLVDGLYEKVPNRYLRLSKSDYNRYVDLYDAHRNAYIEARTAITNYIDKNYKHKDVKRYVENRLTSKDINDLIGDYMQYKIYSGESGSYLIQDEEHRKKG